MKRKGGCSGTVHNSTNTPLCARYHAILQIMNQSQPITKTIVCQINIGKIQVFDSSNQEVDRRDVQMDKSNAAVKG
jgi:hypothetical protein